MGKQSIPQKLPSKMTQHLQSCSNASQAWEALTAARSNSDMLSAFQTELNLTTLTQKVSLGARNRQTSLRPARGYSVILGFNKAKSCT